MCFGWLLIRSSAGRIVGGGVVLVVVGQSGKSQSTRRGYVHLSLSLNPTCLAILSHASLLIGLFLLLIDPCIAVVYYQKKNLMFSTPVIVSFISSHWDTQADKGVLPHWSFRDIEPPPHSSP